MLHSLILRLLRIHNRSFIHPSSFHKALRQFVESQVRSVKHSRVAMALLIGYALVFLPCCTSQAPSSMLPLDPPAAFSATGEQELSERWWTSFEDEQLNELVSKALDSNFSVLAVWQRFRAAEAVVNRESSFLLPELETFFSAGRSYPEPDFRGGENQQIGASASYEVDLWGRIRSQVQAERYRAEATRADYQAATLSLAAEVARTWYQLLAAGRQRELILNQIETNENILKLIVARFGSGQIRGVDILRQKQLIAATREQQIVAESNIAVLEHQLAVLLGIPPQTDLGYTLDSLPNLPPLPETGLPLALVQRRPDVRRDFRILQAANREVASAISARYPRLSLNVSAAARSNEVDDLFRNWAYSLGGNLVAPLFYGGRLSAEVNRTRAVEQQRLYEYGKTILVAFREVEDALVQERKQQERTRVLIEQVTLAQRAYDQLRVQYFNGLSDYLEVLTAINQEQQLQRDLITAQLTLLEFRIGLYRALAGGFETNQRRRDSVPESDG